MQLIKPTTNHQRKSRDLLIKNALRPEELPFPIAEEYPLVLGQGDNPFSCCISISDKIIAHANFWPRTIVSESNSIPIALIGNVATDKEYQGRGYMRKLFQGLDQKAREKNIHALILWSDLHKFYQKLGFESVGTEIRLRYKVRKLSGYISGKYQPIDPMSLSEKDFKSLLDVRHQVKSTLYRSIEEFKILASIPAMGLFISFNQSNQIDGYCLIGKGYDMMGVIHEWGSQNPEHLLQGIADIGDLLEYEEIIVLAPAQGSGWIEALSNQSASVERQPMALAKIISDVDESVLNELFIWGLDSI